VSITIPQRPEGPVVDVRPGDQAATTEVEGWLQAYATSRDPVLRERIILSYLTLADRLASRYRHSGGTTPEDLIQTARAGLIRAIDRTTQPTTEASCRSRSPAWSANSNATCADTSWRVHVPRPLKEQALRVCRAADELHQSLGRGPTSSELAAHLEMSEEAVLEAWAAVTSRQELSLDQPVGDDGDVCLGGLVAAPRAREEPEDLLALAGMVAALPKLEREVIVLRFFQDLDQDTIAARIGYSQMHLAAAAPRPGPHARPTGGTVICRLATHAPVKTGPYGSTLSRQRARRCRLRLVKGGGSMEIIWMVLVTLMLALSGILALALMTQLAAWTRRR